jgi:hypothetical protein
MSKGTSSLIRIDFAPQDPGPGVQNSAKNTRFFVIKSCEAFIIEG